MSDARERDLCEGGCVLLSVACQKKYNRSYRVSIATKFRVGENLEWMSRAIQFLRQAWQRQGGREDVYREKDN